MREGGSEGWSGARKLVSSWAGHTVREGGPEGWSGAQEAGEESGVEGPTRTMGCMADARLSGLQMQKAPSLQTQQTLQ